jgi:hypothetical protein
MNTAARSASQCATVDVLFRSGAAPNAQLLVSPAR